MKSIKMKKYYIFSGVNGAGKTTLYNTKRNIDLGTRINYDEVYFYDNTIELKLIASYINGKLDIIDNFCFWFNKLYKKLVNRIK